MGLEEKRIHLTGEAQKQYVENFKQIEGMDERKKKVLEECRRKK